MLTIFEDPEAENIINIPNDRMVLSGRVGILQCYAVDNICFLVESSGIIILKQKFTSYFTYASNIEYFGGVYLCIIQKMNFQFLAEF